MTVKIPLVAVLGHPIGHSLSPKVHGHWLSRYKIPGHYVPIDVAPEKLSDTLRILPQLGFVGANVTLPHKEALLEIADHVTDRAKLIGAANTLMFGEDGTLQADNTDGYGFIANMRQYAPEWRATAGPAVVIGAGGASRAVIAALLGEGVPEIYLTNRSRTRAEHLRKLFGNRIRIVDWLQASATLPEGATIVNTTSLGLVGQPDLPFNLSGINPHAVVTDLVYSPLETSLLAAARQLGCTVVDGLGMLLHQAVPGFEIWFGHRPEVDDTLRQAVLDA